jgi:hypothetical protein
MLSLFDADSKAVIALVHIAFEILQTVVESV